MANTQPGILAPIPSVGRHLYFSIEHSNEIASCLQALRAFVDGEQVVVGLGQSTVLALGHAIAGLKPFPDSVAPGLDIPATPAALWCWLRGEDNGKLFHVTRKLEQLLAPAFRLSHSLSTFKYDSGRDLTGYEDGTENPEGDEALAAAIVAGQGSGLDGSSFVAVQQWVHQMEAFSNLPQQEQDNIMGRRLADNAELDDAPLSAHVKRTAQESFDPEAFILRRSMPWAEQGKGGLAFVAFGKSLAAFEAQWRRMTGQEDGICDALFRFTRPVTGAYFWCPPLANQQLDLSALGL